MQINEVFEPKKKLKEKKARAGVYPVYTDETGQTYVYMMVPSDPAYGGSKPQMGKGGVDKGETHEQAALREGHEELGLRSDNISKVYHLHKETIRGLDAFYTLSVFVAEVIDKDNFDPHGYEASWTGWVEIEDAIQVSRTNQLKFIKMVADKYKNEQPLEEEVDASAAKIDAYEALISKLQIELDALEARIKELQKEGDPQGLFHERNKVKAKLQHAKSQVELITKLDVDPVGQPYPDDDSRSHGFPEANWGDWARMLAPMIKRIQKECEPYLEAIDYNVLEYRLYRGMKGTNEPYMTGRVRLEGRKPQATGTHVHDAVNEWFTKKFGEPFRNALFTSSDPSFAADYGNLFIVFPTGNFSFVWSEEVEDMYNLEYALDERVEQDKEEGNTDIMHSHIGDYMKELGYRTSGFTSAMHSGQEIMIRTPVYYGINLSNFFKRNDYDDDDYGDASEINQAMKILQELLRDKD